jgi:hypothetical protein
MKAIENERGATWLAVLPNTSALTKKTIMMLK